MPDIRWIYSWIIVPDYLCYSSHHYYLHCCFLTNSSYTINITYCVLVSTDVARPQVLRDWSTVGSTSVSVVWRCNSNVRNVDAFLLYYRPLLDAEKRRRTPRSLDPTQLAALTETDLLSAGFSRIRVHRFLPKRSQAVLRDLKLATDYVLVLFAVNQLAQSLPSIFFFQTAPDEGVNKRILSRRRPVGRPLCNRLMAFVAQVVRAMLSILLFCYVVISAVLIVVYRDTLYNDLCYAVSWSELSEVICPVGHLEPSEAAVHTTQEPWYLKWLYMFSDWCGYFVALLSFHSSLFKWLL